MRILFILLFLFSSVASAAVYKRVNPDGSVEFTDAPRSNKEKPIPLSPTNTFKATPAPVPQAFENETKAAPLKYRNISITNPVDDEAVRNNAGTITVSVTLTPPLQKGHKLVILMDGNPVGEASSGSLSLDNVDRGTHTISAEVRNKKNKTLISAKPVTTHLLRRSILHR